MPSNPDICECGSQLFTVVWAVTHKESDESDDQLDPKVGNTLKRPVGFECVECGRLQLTCEIPQRHADDGSLDHPEAADRDMVRESGDDARWGRATTSTDGQETESKTIRDRLRNLTGR